MVKYDSQKIDYQLHIDSGYYNTLDIEGFSRMMKDPSYCYKFYWLEAIVQLISEDRKEASYDEIINEMISNAWYSVLEFHVHLSGIWGDGEIKDSLEKAVLKLHKLSDLPSNASKIEIKNKIAKYDKELHGEKMTLTQNVPYKALSGFANRYSECIDLNSSAGRMMAYYNRINGVESPLPYTFGDQKGLERKIIFHESWIKMIQDNMVAILGWIQYEKVRWLQNNNPEVPGLVYKLAPLDEKMRKLGHVRKLWEGVLDMTSIIDVFKNEPIKKEAYDGTGLIYGIGHAVYTLSDPRAVLLKEMARKLAEEKGRTEEFEFMERIEKLSVEAVYDIKGRSKKLCANVDFYSGFVYDLIGLPIEIYTPLFAMARIVGWCAHRNEELGFVGRRIIRPAYRCVAELKEYKPVTER